MAINERLVHTASAVAAAGGGNQEEGLILHLDANDVDSYDGDGTEWVDIANHEYKPTTNVSEHFNTVTYTGNGASNPITGVGFQPDLVWVKEELLPPLITTLLILSEATAQAHIKTYPQIQQMRKGLQRLVVLQIVPL